MTDSQSTRFLLMIGEYLNLTTNKTERKQIIDSNFVNQGSIQSNTSTFIQSKHFHTFGDPFQ